MDKNNGKKVKTIRKIVIKLSLLMCPFFVLCPLMVSHFPMRFLDGEYPEFAENKEFVESNAKKCRVLIMGDSSAKSGLIPAELSEDAYNFALMGSTPVQQYYYLKDYLEIHDAPECIIYMQHPLHFRNMESFWTRDVYFHRFEQENIKELMHDLEKYKETSIFGEAGELYKEYLPYSCYLPTKYIVCFMKGLLPIRYKQNMEKYEYIIQNDGKDYYGTQKEYYSKSGLGIEDFEMNEILGDYFEKIIKLCDEYKIQFIFLTTPINEGTYINTKINYWKNYKLYLLNIQKKYPQAIIDIEIKKYKRDYYGDFQHLNEEGAIKLSHDIREKYNSFLNFCGDNDRQGP